MTWTRQRISTSPLFASHPILPWYSTYTVHINTTFTAVPTIKPQIYAKNKKSKFS